ncbi:MAG: leucine-rich repeat domain-containing protein [Promethearchaeota archaeon]
MGYWDDKEFEQERKIVAEDFCEKIRLLEPNRKLHPVTHLNYIVKPSQGVIGLRALKNVVKSKAIKEIKAVNLEGWGLTSIPEEIFEMENLEYLFLDFNNLSTIPTGLSKLKHLKLISLKYNNITALTDGTMSVLKKIPLESLELRNNDITLLPESLKEISVEMLDLSYNKLYVIPEFLKDIKGLKTLYLRGYELDKIPSLIKKSKIRLEADFIYNSQE